MIDMKAVITCGGSGTRLLPFTKEMPKEMAPIFWKQNGTIQVKPLLELIFEQLYEYGVRDFCFITGRTKRAIENHFTPDSELKQQPSMKAFFNYLQSSKIFWTTQFDQKGFGNAVSYASSYVGLDNFIVQAGDVAIINSKGQNPIQRLIDLSQKSKADAVLLVRKVTDPERHGIVTVKEGDDNLLKITKAVEKPDKPETDLGIMPIYLFNPLIFPALEKTQPGRNNEIQLTDAIQKLIESGKDIRAIRVDEEKFLDVGVPDSYWKALTDSHHYMEEKL
jgi:UTP--glucose-1-phosphate uridylyltransferase